MLFVSGAFCSLNKAPHWLQGLSRVLPFSHFVDAPGFSMESDASGIVLPIRSLVGFAALFLVMAVITFHWDAEGRKMPTSRVKD